MEGFQRSDLDLRELFFGHTVNFIGYDSLTLGDARSGGALRRFRRRLRWSGGGGLGGVGGDLVESWGGEVRLANFEDGYSTTKTIGKMKDET